MTGIGIYELIVLFAVACILAIPFWIVALIDILKSNFEGNDKLVWLIVITVIPVLGVILYFIIGRKKKIKAG